MSTAVSTDEPGSAVASRHGADDESALPELADPAERGTLTIADRVVERVAGYAVSQVEGASAAPRRVLGVSVGDARPDQAAAVDAQVDGGTATVEATIAIAWPASVRTVAAQLRRAVREDVERMTGVQVAHVDIDVVSMNVPAARPRRVQ